MADTRYQVSNSHLDSAHSAAGMAVGAGILVFFGVTAVALAMDASGLAVFLGAFAAIGIACALYDSQGGAARSSGGRGEQLLLEAMNRLPDSYVVFNQVYLPNPRSRTGTTEVDVLVVGPNGVFILEGKNNKGLIDAFDDRPFWTVHRVGRGGTPYKKTMRNPIWQAKRQQRVALEFLRGAGVNPFVRTVVVMTNPQVQIRRAARLSLPVVHDLDKLRSAITGAKAKRSYDQGRTVELIAGLEKAGFAHAA